MTNADEQPARRRSAWAYRHWWLVLIIGGAVVAIAVGIALSAYQLAQTEPLMRQADDLAPGDIRVLRQREVLQFQADNLSKIWTTIVQAMVAVVLGVGGYFTYRNLRATQEKLEVDREAQVTNRFTQAIEQLGATKENGPNLEVRLGGIYALERIAHDSPRDHWTIMEVLTAYVRENSRWVDPTPPADGVGSDTEAAAALQSGNGGVPAPPVGTDIQAILTVLGRRAQAENRTEPDGLDLEDTNLRRATLFGHWERADFLGAHLETANLSAAHFERAFLFGVRLESAILAYTHLEHAKLGYAHLQGTNLTDAHLEEADLEGAVLDGAKLAGAHLETAEHLTQEQVYRAENHGKDALLPSDWPDDWRERLEQSHRQAQNQTAASSTGD